MISVVVVHVCVFALQVHMISNSENVHSSLICRITMILQLHNSSAVFLWWFSSV
jgi:hypothetical protein